MSQKRLGNIDALRGVAVLAVFIQHAFMDVIAQGEGGFARFAGEVLSTIDTGRLGVIVFFLISGFVVPYSIKPDRPVRGFIVSRLFRLYPAFWASLILFSVILTALGMPPSAMQFLANATMAARLFGQEWMSGVYWTLLVELLFYGAVIVLFMLGVLYRPLVVAAVGLTLALTTIVPSILPEHMLPVQYWGLFLSVMFCGLLLRVGFLEGQPLALVLAGALFVVQLVGVITGGEYSVREGVGFAAFGTGSAVMADVIGFTVFIAAILLGRAQTGFLRPLATISYSFYLLHTAVNMVVFNIMPLTGEWSDLIAVGVSLAVTICLASASYHWIERPFIALGRRMLAPPRASLAKT